MEEKVLPPRKMGVPELEISSQQFGLVNKTEPIPPAVRFKGLRRGSCRNAAVCPLLSKKEKVVG